jgi:hypothetical protein
MHGTTTSGGFQHHAVTVDAQPASSITDSRIRIGHLRPYCIDVGTSAETTGPWLLQLSFHPARPKLMWISTTNAPAPGWIIAIGRSPGLLPRSFHASDNAGNRDVREKSRIRDNPNVPALRV